MSGLRGTLVLLLVVATLVLGLYLTGGEAPVGPELEESALGGQRMAEARVITLRSQRDVRPLELRRTPSGVFELTEPVRDLASAERFRAMAGAWDTALLLRAYEPEALTPDLLAQLGLDRPLAEIEIEFDQRTLRVEIGEEEPLGNGLYVRRDGVVYIGSKALLSSLQGTFDDFRERLVFPFGAGGFRRLSLLRRRSGGVEDRLVVRGVRRGEFLLEEPLEARASAAQVSSLLASLVGMQADVFVAGNFTPPRDAEVELELETDRAKEQVLFWRTPSGVLLGFHRGRELVFQIRAQRALALDVAAENLRSTLLLRTLPDDIVELRIDPGVGRGVPVTLRRGNDQLLGLVAPVRVSPNPTGLTVLRQALVQLTAQGFASAEVVADPARTGLAEGYLTVEVKGQLQRRTEILHLGNVEGDLCYVKRADESHVALVPRACRDAFAQPWTAYVDRAVYRNEAIDNVRRLRLVVAGEGEEAPRVAVYHRGNDGAWRRGGEDQVRPEVVRAMAALADLRAAEVIDPGEFSPAPGAAQGLEIEMLAENEMLLQRFDAVRVGDRVLLKRDRIDALYELEAGQGAAIRAILP